MLVQYLKAGVISIYDEHFCSCPLAFSLILESLFAHAIGGVLPSLFSSLKFKILYASFV